MPPPRQYATAHCASGMPASAMYVLLHYAAMPTRQVLHEMESYPEPLLIVGHQVRVCGAVILVVALPLLLLLTLVMLLICMDEDTVKVDVKPQMVLVQEFSSIRLESTSCFCLS